MAVKKPSVLLVAFAPSHEKHNSRVSKALREHFEVKFISFSQSGIPVRVRKSRIYLSRTASSLSLMYIMARVQGVYLLRKRRKREDLEFILVDLLNNFLCGDTSFTSKLMSLNSRLRVHRLHVQRANLILSEAKSISASAVIFPEDSNFYGSYPQFKQLHDAYIPVIVYQYTVGTEQEYAIIEGQKRNNTHFPYNLFSRLNLNVESHAVWLEANSLFKSFPGIFRTRHFGITASKYASGLANLYVSSSPAELDFLKRISSGNSKYEICEPLELTLALKEYNSNNQHDKYFALFLPPDQMTDPVIRARMKEKSIHTYEILVKKIISDTMRAIDGKYRVIIFPHPRTQISHPVLINNISEEFFVSNDFSQYLLQINFALIFGSAVFVPLRNANVRVFNNDIFQYEYASVFPEHDTEFINIKSIDQIKNYLLINEVSVDPKKHPNPNFIEILSRYL